MSDLPCWDYPSWVSIRQRRKPRARRFSREALRSSTAQERNAVLANRDAFELGVSGGVRDDPLLAVCSDSRSPSSSVLRIDGTARPARIGEVTEAAERGDLDGWA
jgi:hypothetical protein